MHRIPNAILVPRTQKLLLVLICGIIKISVSQERITCNQPRPYLALDYSGYHKKLMIIHRFLLLLKIGFVTLDPPRGSDKLCILLQGFV